MKLEAVFFDFDGVICDSVNIKTEAFSEIYRQYGERIEKAVVDFHLSNGGMSRHEKFKFWHKQFFNTEISQNELEQLASEFSNLVLKKVIESDYIHGALDTLNFLKSENIPMYIVSATPDSEINEIIIKRNLTLYFNGVHGSPLNKEIIVADILFRENYNPRLCLFVGDSLNDLQAAKSNKLQFLGIIDDYNKAIFPRETTTSTILDISYFV